jgi:hypothetical protein
MGSYCFFRFFLKNTFKKRNYYYNTVIFLFFKQDMKRNKTAFSLLEIIIATWIITIWVFWVYKTTWENIKTVNNSWNLIQAYQLFPIIKECINNLQTNNADYNIFLWNNLNDCQELNKISTINNYNYLLWVKKISGTVENIEWEISIKPETTRTITWSYIQKK